MVGADNAQEHSPKLGESLEDGINSASPIEQFQKAYKLGKKVNSGAFGVIYEAHHVTITRETFAVKIMDRIDQTTKNDALHEAEILYKLRNVPNIVQLMDLYMDNSTIHIVEEFARGGDVLDRLVLRHHYTENCARELAQILLSTIVNVHSRQIVHRDLKPENLLLKDDTDDAEILLCDFGTAKELPKDGYLISFVGSPAFMAPEMVNGYDYDEKIDVWSIGCILFMLLGGYFPFGGPESGEEIWDRILDGDFSFANSAWDAVSEDAKIMIENLLNIDPRLRWSAADALECDWFKASGLQTSDLVLSLKGIKKFCARRKLKGAMAVVRATTGSFRKHLKNLGIFAKKETNTEPMSTFQKRKSLNIQKRNSLNIMKLTQNASNCEDQTQSETLYDGEDELLA